MAGECKQKETLLQFLLPKQKKNAADAAFFCMKEGETQPMAHSSAAVRAASLALLNTS